MSYYINNTGKMVAAAAVTRAVVGGPVTQEEKRGCFLATVAWLAWCALIIGAVVKLAVTLFDSVFG